MGSSCWLRNAWADKQKTESFWIASPLEEERIRRSRECTQEGVREGAKAAAIAGVVSAIPTLAAVRMIPWAKANLNYTAQALIISGASIAAYFITADKTILECARRNAQYDKST
ncbi:OLC1v1029130C1 [Oldenlandia corymbosa var. corymbosa]|uniref:OLC1v1029130C1 n=1 Tax=Oldenlandia corymbosa var. corymbosa TaxID=529605 RepID=A0AAV1CDA3_OLDCO|nr:OLC1v1029130C1 [Oldenlandia corymbosa var. corymbosa]